MRHLIIRNIGPVKLAEIELKRFNFIIGPQSSGKSTIAKILSTCSWVEKEMATTIDEHAVADAAAFRALMDDFHKMTDYFVEDSEIQFETDVVKISLKGESFNVQLKNQELYRREKICYIPSERNSVTLPELQGYEFGPTNLRSFLFDWFNARENYDEIHKTDILDLGVKYYYDPNDKRYKDRIEHKNGKTYHMPLGSASSGLQSVIPLIVMFQYYTGQYFETYNERLSFQTDEKTRKIRRHLTDDIILKRSFPDYDSSNRQYFVELANKRLQENNQEMLQLYKVFYSELQRMTMPVITSFIVEEPEQNLFPDTQMELMDTLFALCDGKRKHELTVTTHSPYILNQLNLLFRRFDEKDNAQVGVDYNDVSVYAVNEGHVSNIKLQNVHLINPEYLSAPLDKIYNQYEAYDKH